MNTVKPTVKNPFSPDDRYYRMGMRSCTSLAWMNYTESDKTVDAVRILYHPNTYIAYGYCLVRVNENYFASYSNVQFDNEQYILILDETNTVLHPIYGYQGEKLLRMYGRKSASAITMCYRHH